jgi:hypothetical protein
MKLDGSLICAMPAVYTTPPRLRPLALWYLRLGDGRVASATLAPTADSCAVVWYLNDDLQDAAQFPDREAAVAWANDVRMMLLASAVA